MAVQIVDKGANKSMLSLRLALQGNRRRRRSAADPFLANRIQHVYDGRGFTAPSDSDSEESESEPSSASEDGEEGSAAEDNLDDFIVRDAEDGPATDAGADGEAVQ